MKKMIIIFLILISGFTFLGDVHAESKIKDVNLSDVVMIGDSVSACTKLKSPLKFIGYIVLVFKIVIPIVLIIYGMLDLFKAVTGGQDGEIFKSLKNFVFRVIAGVAIFFLPTIVSFVFDLIDSWADVKSDANVCIKCILHVSQCD